MDITIDVDDYRLNVRAAAIIIHNNKLLVHKNRNDNYYALLGGRVKFGENSEETIKREILEETGKEIEIKGYISTIENFFEINGLKYQEILFVYEAEFKNENDKLIQDKIKNVEGNDNLQYEWVDLNELNDVPLRPGAIKEILKDNVFPVHRINDDMKYKK